MPPRNNKTRSYQRCSAWYRERGYAVVKTEHKFRGRSHDYLGVIDFHALNIGDLIGVQACGADWKPHVDKMLGSHRDNVVLWLNTGNRLQLMGWRKLKRSGRAMWTPRLSEFVLDIHGMPVLQEIFK